MKTLLLLLTLAIAPAAFAQSPAPADTSAKPAPAKGDTTYSRADIAKSLQAQYRALLAKKAEFEKGILQIEKELIRLEAQADMLNAIKSLSPDSVSVKVE